MTTSTPISLPGRSRRMAAALALTPLVVLACETRSDPNTMAEFVISEVDTLVSLESELLASPRDVVVDEAGNVYVLDGQLASVLVLPASGSTPITRGGEGGGPGEFSRPTALAVDADSIRIVDSGNGRVQVLTSDGSYVRSYPMPAEYIGGVTLSADGHMAVSTQGFREEALALTFDAKGHPTGRFGTLVVPGHEFWDMTAIRADIMDGEVPRQLRNWSLPILDVDGSLWLILNAEGVIQRYDAEGSLLWALQLEAPEMPRIKERFFERNRELDTPGFVVLAYVADAVAVREDLWVLLDVPDEDPCLVLVIAPDGTVRRRLDFPNVYGASELAVDLGRRRVYLTVPSDASLLVASLPEGS